jgi:hypothetical protein
MNMNKIKPLLQMLQTFDLIAQYFFLVRTILYISKKYCEYVSNICDFVTKDSYSTQYEYVTAVTNCHKLVTNCYKLRASGPIDYMFH